jgi:hypothetical protein
MRRNEKRRLLSTVSKGARKVAGKIEHAAGALLESARSKRAKRAVGDLAKKVSRAVKRSTTRVAPAKQRIAKKAKRTVSRGSRQAKRATR